MFLFSITTILICIILSAFFSGVEMGLLSLNHLKLRHEVEIGRKKAITIYNLVKNPTLIIVCILIGNCLVNVSASVLTASLYEDKELLSGIILAIIILIFGETIPKAIFRRERNKLIVFLAPILKLTFNLFSPLLKILSHLTSSLKEIKDKEENYLTKERMKILIDEGEKGGVVGKNEGEIINGVFELSEVKVKEVMTPRVNMICVEAETKLKEVIKIFKEHKYSRIPVYDGNIDEIIGIIYIKDLLNFWNFEKEDLRAIEFIRLPFFIPESKPIGDLLKEFRQKMIHVAIVVDEYGGTTGIVTLEDLLEEIFGEIEDEYDKEEIQIKSIGKNVYLIDGDTEIEKIKEILKIEFPKGDFETISGYILEVLKHIPSPGEVIKLNDNIITIIDSDEQSINRIKIEKF